MNAYATSAALDDDSPALGTPADDDAEPQADAHAGLGLYSSFDDADDLSVSRADEDSLQVSSSCAYDSYIMLTPLADVDHAAASSSDEEEEDVAPVRARARVLPEMEILDWQAEFETILSGPFSTVEEKLARTVALKQLNDKFAHVAQALGKIIVEDIRLPVDKRTFKPLRNKGVLGGEKYLTHGIFFKLTRDQAGIFGGDMGAAKSAKHEIKSLQALVGCGTEGLFFPLLCVVDYLGFRLVCTSFIRGVSGRSLKYGSCNGGKDIFADDPILNAKIRRTLAKLNLKEHNVIDSDGRARLLWGPADLEGHVVETDDPDNPKRYYLLDFSRLFPPESPEASGATVDGYVLTGSDVEYFTEYKSCLSDRFDRVFADADNPEYAPRVVSLPRSQGVLYFDANRQDGERNTRATEIAQRPVSGPAIVLHDLGRIFYQLLRPELVAAYQYPLSSDAFSGFGSCRKCVTAVRELRAVMPELVKNAGDRSQPPLPAESDAVHATDKFCPHGMLPHHVDLTDASRFLVHHVIAKFVERLERREISPSDSPALVRELHAAGINCRYMGIMRRQVESPGLRQFLLEEMIVRTLRHVVTQEMRECMVRGLSPFQGVTDLFNKLFGRSDASERFWRYDMSFLITRKFAKSLTHDELAEDFDMRQGCVKFALFLRLQECTGVAFTPEVNDAFFNDAARFEVEAPFTTADLLGVRPLVKSMKLDQEIVGLVYEQSLLASGSMLPIVSHADPDPSASARPQLGRARSLGRVSSADLGLYPSLREDFFSRLCEQLGKDHPTAISTALKVALSRARSGLYEDAAELVEATNALTQDVIGKHTHGYIVGLVTLGEVQLAFGETASALRYFAEALNYTEKLFGRHPLVGKLCAYIGRVHTTEGRLAEGIEFLHRAYEIYTVFYTKSVAQYLAPLITLGKAEEMATSISDLAYKLLPLVRKDIAERNAQLLALQNEVPETAIASRGEYNIANDRHALSQIKARLREKVPLTPTMQVFSRLRAAVSIIEDMEGLPRGYYNNTALDFEEEPTIHTNETHGESTLETGEQELQLDFGGDAPAVRVTGPERVSAGATCVLVLHSSDCEVASCVIDTPEVAGHALDGLVCLEDAHIEILFSPIVVGTYTVTIEAVQNGHTATTSLQVQVLAGAAMADCSYVLLPARAIATEELRAMFVLIDAFGNHVREGAGQLTRAHTRLMWDLSSRTGSLHEREQLDGVVVTKAVPIVEGVVTLHFWLNGRRVPCDAKVQLHDQAGLGFCGNRIADGMPSESARLCQSCSLSLMHKCVRCQSRLFHNKVSARICMQCANAGHWNNKCVRCTKLAFQAFPAFICGRCTGPNRITCSARV